MKNNNSNKIIIAHRGASGYLPEHTLEAKAMAYAMGADYLEQDLVLSKDDIPIVIHTAHNTGTDIVFENGSGFHQLFDLVEQPCGRVRFGKGR